jgi:predicted DNA-binding transcriptional regulator AlpA
MKSRWLFILVVAGLTVVDAYLISNPNLLGKLGFIIYKYHYLRTFPKALLTVGIVISIAWSINEILVWISRRGWIFKKTAKSVYTMILVVIVFLWVKTALDFQGWAFSHSGIKLKYGAYLLPIILLIIYIRGLYRIIKQAPR